MEIKPSVNTPDELPFLLTVKEAANFLRIDKNKVYELTYAKGFPVVVIGRRRLIHRNGLIRWLESRSQGQGENE